MSQEKTRAKNIAFINGQNLHLGTKEDGWKVDLTRFRVYLRDKYYIVEAYYFLGYVSDEQEALYSNLQRAGFIVVFKEHHQSSVGKKKGNVDSDIIFEIMRTLIDDKLFAKIVLVSGDGDYKKAVDYLIKKNRFEKILFPNEKFASSLYKKLTSRYFDYLSRDEVRNKVSYTT
jgi:uncharacterized LabA/DUF88 family protein